MKLRKIRTAILLVVGAGVLGLGCELLVDFDRTKIPVDSTDSAVPAVDSSIDATIDAVAADADAGDAADAADTAVVDAADAADAG